MANNVNEIRAEVQAAVREVELQGAAREAEKEALLNQVRAAKHRLRELAKEGREDEKEIMALRLAAGKRMLEAQYPRRLVNRWKADRETWDYRCYAAARGSDLRAGWTEDPTNARAEIDWEVDEAEEWLHDGNRLGMLPEEHERVREEREADYRATFNGAYDYVERPDSEDEDVAGWIG